VSVSGKVGPRTAPPLGCTRYRDNLLQDQALSLDDNSLSAISGHQTEVFITGLEILPNARIFLQYLNMKNKREFSYHAPPKMSERPERLSDEFSYSQNKNSLF